MNALSILPSASPDSAITLITEGDLAALLGIDVKTLRNRRYLGDSPPWIDQGKKKLFLLPDVEAWLLSKRIAPGAKAAVQAATAQAVAAQAVEPAKRKAGRPKGGISKHYRVAA